MPRIAAIVYLISVVVPSATAAIAEPTTRPADLGDWADSPHWIVLQSGTKAPESIVLERSGTGESRKLKLINRSKQPMRLGEAVVAYVRHGLTPESSIYGEGFQMLSQTGGTLAKPVDIGFYTDRKHYRIAQPPDATTLYGVAILRAPSADRTLMGFPCCERFSGAIRLRTETCEAVIDLEGLEIRPGETWDLGELAVLTGANENGLWTKWSQLIQRFHPPRSSRLTQVPTGWCSWYCFGPQVTYAQLAANVQTIQRNGLPLRFFQVDDGFQRAMGDWLELRDGFGGDMASLGQAVRAAGMAFGMWAAPFCAEANSRVFRDHPDWFVKGPDDKPLASDRVSFGGWRNGPWYVLDGTHPQVQAHLERTFRTMREDWGCTYFKLDANFWGAIHGGRHHDPHATRIEAYRRGMAAILRGAGDAFILGCNHPMAASYGLIDGARSSMDVDKSWDYVRRTSVETFCRYWQHGRLWLNDPDVLMLGDYYQPQDLAYRVAVVHASGGLLLLGDDLTRLPTERVALLHRLLPPTGVSAVPTDESFRVAIAELKDRRLIYVFNPGESARTETLKLPQPARLRELISGQDLGPLEGDYTVPLAPHGAVILECVVQAAGQRAH